MKLDPSRAQIISGFVHNYLKLNAAELREFAREIELLPEEEQEAIMPLTITWKEEGRAEGRVEDWQNDPYTINVRCGDISSATLRPVWLSVVVDNNRGIPYPSPV